MEMAIAVGVLVLVVIGLVGLFHGPSHRPHRPAPRRSPAAPRHAPPAGIAPEPTVPPGTDPPAYVLPPDRRRRRLPRRPLTGPRSRHS